MATVVKPDPQLSRTNPLHTQGQGDLLVPEEHNRNVITKNKRWPNRRVPYANNMASPKAKAALAAAIADMSSLTCVKWVPKTSADKYYVNLVSKNGCYSYQGNIQRQGGQELSLGNGCEYKAIATHEMMHAMGHIHEHQRADRDKYITVFLNNVASDQRHNFALSNGVDEEKGDVQGGAYCYNSIMHYTGNSFSSNGQPSMTSKLAGVTLGQTRQQGITDYDIEQIKKYYEC